MAPISKKMRDAKLLNQVNLTNSDQSPGDYSSDSNSSKSFESIKVRSSSVSYEGKTLFLDKNSEEYRQRRERNNIAVRKSRCKSKLKSQQTLARINLLEEENKKLHSKIAYMSNRLDFMRCLLINQTADGHGLKIPLEDLNGDKDEKMLNEIFNDSYIFSGC